MGSSFLLQIQGGYPSLPVTSTVGTVLNDHLVRNEWISMDEAQKGIATEGRLVPAFLFTGSMEYTPASYVIFPTVPEQKNGGNVKTSNHADLLSTILQNQFLYCPCTLLALPCRYTCYASTGEILIRNHLSPHSALHLLRFSFRRDTRSISSVYDCF